MTSLKDYLNQFEIKVSQVQRFSEYLRLAENQAQKLNRSEMMIEFSDGLVLSHLIKTLQPRSVLEIGVFTGYSGLWILQALPVWANYLGLEKNPDQAHQSQELFKSYIEAMKKDIHAHVQVGDADEILTEFVNQEPLKKILYDFIFVDANKSAYLSYWKKAYPLLAPGGLIVFDNAFLYGEALTGVAKKFSEKQIQIMRQVHQEVLQLGGYFLPTSDGFLCLRKP